MCPEFTGSTQPKLRIQASMNWSHLCSENLERYSVFPLPKNGTVIVDFAPMIFPIIFWKKSFRVMSFVLEHKTRQYFQSRLSLGGREVKNVQGGYS